VSLVQKKRGVQGKRSLSWGVVSSVPNSRVTGTEKAGGSRKKVLELGCVVRYQDWEQVF
jgi:hypothetical protein